jgi:hypothetical protein
MCPKERELILANSKSQRAETEKPGPTAAEIERLEAGWRSRAVMATRGNQTMLGCMVQAVIGVAANNPPTMGITAIIDADGIVRTNLIKRDRATGANVAHVGVPVGSTIQVRDEWRFLADHIKATDAEREEMFDLLRKWAGTDFRAILDPEQQVRPDV